MRNSNKTFLKPNRIFSITSGLLVFLIIVNCTEKRLGSYATFYSFDYNGEKYRIRSVFTDAEKTSFNELINKDFLARDYDKDGILDKVLLGQVHLTEAQTIYEYAIRNLASLDRLRSISDNTKLYSYLNTRFNYKIKSFHSDNTKPFNVFKMTRINRIAFTDINVCIDQNADGHLDEIVKGTIPLDEIQTYYTKVIKNGISEDRLVRTQNMVLVK